MYRIRVEEGKGLGAKIFPRGGDIKSTPETQYLPDRVDRDTSMRALLAKDPGL